MNKEDVIREFKEAGALLEGHFILSSGLHSSKYLQCALALSEPSRAQRLSASLGKKILENIKTKILFMKKIIGKLTLHMTVIKRNTTQYTKERLNFFLNKQLSLV